ncbi:hypothetical protein B9Z19DRAFT_145303 [Tuber borchii]|uniref:Secreted protein n=1 Tax=Tuber borchii TaxID=42251 RepID=A0A2T6ZQ92_TUBBO|nr:hypothetical protein B9Z19DRAFT_145303 [Tuber borchii]
MILMGNLVFLFCFFQEIGVGSELSFEHFLRFQHGRTFGIENCVTYSPVRKVLAQRRVQLKSLGCHRCTRTRGLDLDSTIARVI